ncbi:MAG: DUF1573 domain-containing protein [Desulfobacterales bacterium]|jgi:hypothetical protein|nr:MAG: DUF1573 domain-containing protein [Desulfobacterales bacterium]
MRILKQILCLCLVLTVWIGVAQATGAKEAIPVIEVEGSIYEFPQVTQGEVVKHDFRVFNRGNAPLEIKKVKPG